MKITAMDVHRKEFGHSVRGYREDEVDNFLDGVANELDRLKNEIEALEARAREAESKSLNFEAERNTINNALLTAQRASDEVLDQAQKRGREMLEEAEKLAKEIVRSAQEDKQTVLVEIKRLKDAEEQYRMGYIAHLKNSMAAVDEIKLPAGVDKDEVAAAAPVVATAAVETPMPEAPTEEAPVEEAAVPVAELTPEPEPQPEAVPAPAAEPAPRAEAQPFEPIPDPRPTFADPEPAVIAEGFQPVVAEPISEEGLSQFGEMEDMDDLELIS